MFKEKVNGRTDGPWHKLAGLRPVELIKKNVFFLVSVQKAHNSSFKTLFAKTSKKNIKSWCKIMLLYFDMLSFSGRFNTSVMTIFNIISVIRQPVHLSMPSLWVFTSTLHNFLSKPPDAFLYNHCRNNGKQWERNDFCLIDYHQSSERKLTKSGIR